VGAVLLVAAALSALQGAGEPFDPGAPGGLAQDKPHRPWIDDLGADDPALRSAAALRLRSAGRAAWPALEDAARAHPDPEARARARDLLAASRRRREIPFRVLDEHPDAPALLEAGPSAARVALARTLARHFEDTAALLLELLRDRDPEVALAAAEALHENRNMDWPPRLLELFVQEDCPRAGRFYELLSSGASRLPPEALQDALGRSGPRGRNRLVHLALYANLPLTLPSDTLRAMLRHGGPADRREALAWIRERGPQDCLPDLEPLLSEPEPALVADVLSTLRMTRLRPDPRAFDALLSHDDPRVREEAVHLTLAFEERAALPALRPLLDDPSTSVRLPALAAIWKLEGEASLETMMAVYLRDSGEPRDQAAHFLCRAPGWTAERARALRESPLPDRRQRAYELLLRLEGVPALAPLVRDPDEAVRRWSLQQMLRRLDLATVLEAVEAFAKDPAETVRFDALRSLVRMGRRDHVPALRAFLSSREFAFRHDAAETLLEHAADACDGLAASLLDDPEAALRRLAFNALGSRGDRRAGERALRSLHDPDGRLRRSAHEYLAKTLQRDRDAGSVAALAATFPHAEGEPLALAFRLVVEHGDARAARAVRELLLSGRAPSADRALRALADWAGEGAAAELAGLLGTDAALNDLVLARVRDARRRAPQAGAPELRAALERLAPSPDRRLRRAAAEAARDLGFALDGLPALVADPEPSVRHAAVEACVRLGFARALPEIALRLDDEDPDVRIAAVAGLPKLDPARSELAARAAAAEDCAWARRKMEASLRIAAK
jgi:HEAT repeat protein